MGNFDIEFFTNLNQYFEMMVEEMFSIYFIIHKAFYKELSRNMFQKEQSITKEDKYIE